MRKGHRRILIIAGTVVIVAAVLYFFLAQILLHYVNRTLEKGLNGYEGHIGGLSLSLFEGGYQLESVRIDRVEGGTATPFFAANKIDFTLLWKALFRGELAGEFEMDEPVLLLIHGEEETESQGGEDGDWIKVIRDLTPFNLGRGEIRNGEVRFLMALGGDEREIALTQINVVAENLANQKDVDGRIVGEIRGTALFGGQAPVTVGLALDPISEEMYLDADLLVENLNLMELMPVTRTYANFEFERGTAEIAAEIAVKNNEIRGYVKPILHNIGVARVDRDIQQDGDNPFLFTWEKLVGLFAFLLEDKEMERFATIVPITGQLDSPDIDIIEAIGNAFENAYSTSIASGLEHNTDLGPGFEEDPEAYLKKLEKEAVDRAHEETEEEATVSPADKVAPHNPKRNTAP